MMRGKGTRITGMLVTLAVLAAIGGAIIASTVSAQTVNVSVESLSASVNGQGQVRVRAHDVGAPGLGAWTVDVAYDPALVTVVSCSPGSGGICNPNYPGNRVRVTGTSVNGLQGTVTLATITFRCKQIGTGQLSVAVPVLADATIGGPQDIDATVQNGTVACSGAGEPTATPPGGPVVLLGDVNCDGLVTAVDAALVLQLDAGLKGSLPCPQNGDLNGDGQTNSVDAAIILQITAGLL
jgi:hypothetical protein